MPAPVQPVVGGMPVPLAEGVRAFLTAHPECMDPEHQPMYLHALAAALAVDNNPSAAQLREYGLAIARLKKDIAAGAGTPSLEDLLGDDDED